VVKSTLTTNQTRLVARIDGPVLDPSWEVSELGLEDIILAYMGQDGSIGNIGTSISVLGGVQ
jgi:ABC-2 type transport system ATP-binding protein